MKTATTGAVLLLTAIAVLHLLRVIYGVEITADGMSIPIWASWLGILVPGGLAFGIWREHRVR